MHACNVCVNLYIHFQYGTVVARPIFHPNLHKRHPSAHLWEPFKHWNFRRWNGHRVKRTRFFRGKMKHLRGKMEWCHFAPFHFAPQCHFAPTYHESFCRRAQSNDVKMRTRGPRLYLTTLQRFYCLIIQSNWFRNAIKMIYQKGETSFLGDTKNVVYCKFDFDVWRWSKHPLFHLAHVPFCPNLLYIHRSPPVAYTDWCVERTKSTPTNAHQKRIYRCAPKVH